jgi:hypothetical protein
MEKELRSLFFVEPASFAKAWRELLGARDCGGDARGCVMLGALRDRGV